MSAATLHPAPSFAWFESWRGKDGHVVSAFFDGNMGVSCTTQAHVMRIEGGKFEARVGFAIMGPPQMTEAEFKRCGHNPFHPKFHDNFARATGETEADAIEKLGAELKSIGDMLWAE